MTYTYASVDRTVDNPRSPVQVTAIRHTRGRPGVIRPSGTATRAEGMTTPTIAIGRSGHSSRGGVFPAASTARRIGTTASSTNPTAKNTTSEMIAVR